MLFSCKVIVGVNISRSESKIVLCILHTLIISGDMTVIFLGHALILVIVSDIGQGNIFACTALFAVIYFSCVYFFCLNIEICLFCQLCQFLEWIFSRCIAVVFLSLGVNRIRFGIIFRVCFTVGICIDDKQTNIIIPLVFCYYITRIIIVSPFSF